MKNDDPWVVTVVGTTAIVIVLVYIELLKTEGLLTSEATIAIGASVGVVVAFLPVALLFAYLLDKLFEWLGWFAEEREAR